jgi:hypothetical protein
MPVYTFVYFCSIFKIYCFMDFDPKFNLNNIETDSSFNFSNVINSPDIHANPNLYAPDDIESPYNDVNNCSYLDESQFIQRYKDTNKFSFKSLNLQSLAAKYNDFSELINSLNVNHCSPDIICLQETWKCVDSNLFSLPNYHLPIIKQRTSANGGGVELYIKDNLQYNILHENSVFVDRVWNPNSVFVDRVWNPFFLKSGLMQIKK